MNAVYTLKSGNRVSAYFWSDFFKGDFRRGMVDVTPIERDSFTYAGKEKSAKIFEDYKGHYFVWEGQKVYLNDFEALDVTTLSAKIKKGIENKDRWFVREDEILATFQKYSDDVVVLAEMPVFDMIIPFMGIGLTGDKTKKVACVLDDKQYEKHEWGYKIRLVPNDFKDKATVAAENYYFSDFCDMLKSGLFEVVDKSAYISYLRGM